MTEFERLARVPFGSPEVHDDNWLAWYLKGPKGAIQFVITPSHMPPEVVEQISLGAYVEDRHYMGFDVGYHSPTPKFEGQDPMNPCPVYGDVICYYGGTSLPADGLIKMWADMGGNDEVIWGVLEDYYASWLDKDEGELFVSPLEVMFKRLEEED